MANKGKNVFFKKWSSRIFVILIVVFWSVLAFFGLLQKFDYRLYDLMLGLRPNPASRSELLFVEVDNDSLEAMGPWPWTRDIIAESLLRMKELGASQAIFDIEYLSPSNLGVNPNASDELAQAFDKQKDDISGVISELTTAVANGSVKTRELKTLSQQMVDEYINPGLDALYDAVQDSVYQDNDAFFAQALQFFGDSWLTINIADIGITPTDEARSYVVARDLFKNVTDPQSLIEKDGEFYAADQGNQLGFAPALHDFMTHAKGAGFTNIVLDGDGTRRRVILLNKQDGGYVGQLVFAPLLHNLDVQNVIRHARSIELVGALLPGHSERTNITIPVDNHGRMFINWLHREFFDSFRHESILSLAQLDAMEKNVVAYLSGLAGFELRDENNALLPYAQKVSGLLSDYADITTYRTALLARCFGYDETGKSYTGDIEADEYEEYFAARKEFFAGVAELVSGSYLDDMLIRLGAMEQQLGGEQVADIITQLVDLFADLKDDSELYATYFDDMTKQYADAICIIGNTASSTTDLGNTPFNRAYPNVGTHANVYNTIVNGDFITPVDWWIFTLVIALLAVLYTQLTREKAAWVQNTCGALLMLVSVAVPLLAMILFGLYVPVVTPVLIAVTTFLVLTILHFVSSEKDKSFLRNALGTYVSPVVADQLAKNPELLRLGGEEKEMTALFSDIKSFSTFSEMVTPTKLVSVLNEYLGDMSDCILEQGGTIDKYIGDAIVSFFGAPVALENHAYAACHAAIRMKQAEKAYNDAHFANKDIPMELHSRVGLNTGSMVVGNMGTESKFNYTMMGDNVNLASRLEGVNKVYHSWILAAEPTWQLANSGKWENLLVARKFDKVRVVGKDTPVQLYNIVGFKAEMTNDQLEANDMFNQAIDFYMKREFAKAGKLFVEISKKNPQDESPIVFAQRCKEFLTRPLPEDWDGVYQMTSK